MQPMPSDPSSKTSTVGVRLAIRREGAFVNAYLAQEGTMDGAKLLGSLALDVAHHVVVFERWKALMNDILSSAVEAIFGQKPEMTERTAPEHERSGSA